MDAADLFWIGIGLELVGLALVGASDYVPVTLDTARAIGRSVKRLAVSAWWRTARLFGHRRTVYGKVTPGGGNAGGIGPRGYVSAREGSTLEERVEFLEGRSIKTQLQFAEFEHRLGQLPAAWRAEIGTARAELEQRIERRLTETQERYLLARRVGLVSLLAGVACVAASNVLAT